MKLILRVPYSQGRSHRERACWWLSPHFLDIGHFELFEKVVKDPLTKKRGKFEPPLCRKSPHGPPVFTPLGSLQSFGRGGGGGGSANPAAFLTDGVGYESHRATILTSEGQCP